MVCDGEGKIGVEGGFHAWQNVVVQKFVVFQANDFAAVPQTADGISLCSRLALHSTESSPPLMPRHTHRTVLPGLGNIVKAVFPAAH